MDWRAENHSDVQLLDRYGPAPLDAGMAFGDVALLVLIAGHNDRSALAVARFRQLAEDRRRLADFNAWREQDGINLLAERLRLTREGWDALLELRRVLQERQDLLGRIEQRLLEQYRDAGQDHDRAVAAAECRLAEERRALQKVNPSAAASYFAELVAGDESVRQAARQRAAVHDALEGIAAARRSIVAALGAVTARQREVFAALVS